MVTAVSLSVIKWTTTTVCMSVFVSGYNRGVFVCMCVCVLPKEIKAGGEAAVFVAKKFGLIRKRYHVSSVVVARS